MCIYIYISVPMCWTGLILQVRCQNCTPKRSTDFALSTQKGPREKSSSEHRAWKVVNSGNLVSRSYCSCFPFPSAIVLVQMTSNDYFFWDLKAGKIPKIYPPGSLHQAVARNADIFLPRGRWIGNSWWTGTAQTQGTPILEPFLLLFRLGYIGRSWYLAMV